MDTEEIDKRNKYLSAANDKFVAKSGLRTDNTIEIMSKSSDKYNT